MHDPMVVAWEIHLPIPHFRWKQYRSGPRNQFTRRRRTNDENRGEPVYPWWRPCGYNVTVLGRQVKMRDLVTIWHVEPGGRDSGEVCKHYVRWQDEDGTWHHRMIRSWRWHVRHWSVQIHPWGRFCRWAFTRCAWCGGRSTNRDPVNCSHHWEGPRKKHWWQSEPELFHADCSSVHSAHRACLCDDPLLRQGDYGTCLLCGGGRAWRPKDADYSLADEATRLIKEQVPVGGRMPADLRERTRALWKQHHERDEIRRKASES